LNCEIFGEGISEERKKKFRCEWC